MNTPFSLADKLSHPKRQVHLDFHTSPLMPGVGSRFNREAFQAALKAGHVSSITIFAKCHHGLCYYPTTVGTVHPTLDFDLLGEMIEAAHEIGVRAPVYITAGWSDADAQAHPEWRVRNKDGSFRNTNFDAEKAAEDAKPHCSWRNMCLNDGSYCRHIYAITEEICDRYPQLDGLFYDICFIEDACYCPECLEGMRKAGLDPENEADAHKYYVEKHISFMEKCGNILHKKHPNATIFFNSGGADVAKPQYHPYETHYEMEDLPTAWGGYNKMAPNARFFEKTGKFYLGMTGKFHLDWGEFGGFKSKEALRYEACCMALYGAGVSIGDQLYPDGEMDQQTYENIGYAYSYLEKIEPYCYGGTYVSNLGVYWTADTADSNGIANMLLENQMDFTFIRGGDFSGVDTVIFPNGVVLNDRELAGLQAFLAAGGRVLMTGNSLQADGAFQIDCGLTAPQNAPFDCDYIQTNMQGLPKTPFLSYFPANICQPVDAQVYAEILEPFFSRTYGHFCSHRNTPYDKNGPRYPALAKKGNLVYLAHSIGKIYKEYGCLAHRNYFIAALQLLGYRPTTTVSLGSGARVTTLHQPQEHRYCINLTYASPVKRGRAEIIDEILPQYAVSIRQEVQHPITRVYDPLSGEDIPFTCENGACAFTLPKLLCHAVTVLEYSL